MNANYFFIVLQVYVCDGRISNFFFSAIPLLSVHCRALFLNEEFVSILVLMQLSVKAMSHLYPRKTESIGLLIKSFSNLYST